MSHGRERPLTSAFSLNRSLPLFVPHLFFTHSEQRRADVLPAAASDGASCPLSGAAEQTTDMRSGAPGGALFRPAEAALLHKASQTLVSVIKTDKSLISCFTVKQTRRLQ